LSTRSRSRTKTGRLALGSGAHVARWDELPLVIETVYERFDHLDVLVNNAEMSPLYDSVDTASEELLHSVLAVNFKGL